MYYSSQNVLLDAQRKQVDSSLRPTVALFGMGMIHRKINDMMNNGMLVGGGFLYHGILVLYILVGMI